MQAFTGLPVATNVYGRDADGRLYSDMLFCGGGQGASSKRDGQSGLLYPTSAANTSIELMESRAPVLVLEKTFLTDTGGAGRHRGGLGQRVRLRKRDDDGLPMLVVGLSRGRAQPDRRPVRRRIRRRGARPRGRCGGRGAEELRHRRTGRTRRRPTEIVEVVLAGGAGYGDPKQRPRAAVDRDVALGFVSGESATKRYGR